MSKRLKVQDLPNFASVVYSTRPFRVSPVLYDKASETMIRVIVPDYLSFEAIDITVYTSDRFLYSYNSLQLYPSKIFSISLLTAKESETVTINGNYFNPIREYNIVYLKSNTTGRMYNANTLSGNRNTIEFVVPSVTRDYYSIIVDIQGWTCSSVDVFTCHSPWALIDNLSIGQSYANGVVDNGTAWIFGGQNSGNDFQLYSLPGGDPQVLHNYPFYDNMGGVSFKVDNLGYFGLGKNYPENYTKDFYRFDFSVRTWTKLNDFAGNGRTSAFYFTVGKKCYVGGGLNFQDLWEYDVISDQWSYKVDYPRGPSGRAVAFAVNEKAYIIDGKMVWEYNTNIIDPVCIKLNNLLPNLPHHFWRSIQCAGYDFGNVMIEYAKEDKLSELQASTYNLVNDKPEEMPVGKKQFYEESTSLWENTMRFALPQVREGSIIEYSYKLTQDEIRRFVPFRFQRSVPVRHVEFWAVIPEFFKYSVNYRGYDKVVQSHDKQKGFYDTYSTAFDVYHWIGNHLPPLQPEPFMPENGEYFPGVSFSLSSVDFPGGRYFEVAPSYKKLTTDLLTNSDFGSQLNNSALFSKDVRQITAGKATAMEMTQALYDHVKDRIKWNGFDRRIPYESIRIAYRDKTGNNADINTLLINMLRTAGISADPVVLSTRENGSLNPFVALTGDLDYMVCLATIDGKEYLLDATDKFRPLGMLPFKCLKERCLPCTRLLKIRILYEYMQKKTRYFSISFGIGGDQPIPAYQVAKNGYGVCKALSNYMKALLKVAGIESYYTMVNAGDGENIEPGFPGSQFNHAILCVPDKNDTVWLECTSQTAPFGYLGSFTSDRYVLVVTPEGGKIQRTPAYNKSDNVINSRSEITLMGSGDADVRIKLHQTGLFYERLNEMSESKEDERKDQIAGLLGYTAFNVKKEDYTFGKTSVPYGIANFEVRIRDLSSKSSNRLFVSPSLLSKTSYIWEDPTDIELSTSYQQNDTVKIEIPIGFKIEYLPDAFNVDSRFGKYATHISSDNKFIYFTRNLEINEASYPKENYAEFYNFISDIAKNDRKMIIIKSIN